MRIYLVGFMGAGKTTVGRSLARRLQWSFVDLDREVEDQAGASVAEIFEWEGESGFRTREREALRRVARRPRVVVATGGGTLTVPENVELIRSSGTSVFLDAPVDVLFERVERSPRARPLFRDRRQAVALYRNRLDLYRQADLVVPVSAEDRAEGVAARVAARLGRPPCDT